MGEDKAENAFNGDFPKLPKGLPPEDQTHSKSPAESSKINKKTLFFEKHEFFSKRKAAVGLFSEINSDISVSLHLELVYLFLPLHGF